MDNNPVPQERKPTTTAQLYTADLALLQALNAANSSNGRDTLHRLIVTAFEADAQAVAIYNRSQAKQETAVY